MQFSIKRDLLLKSLNLTQGVIEKKNTLPILSNVLLEAKDNKLIIVATDLDLVFYDEIEDYLKNDFVVDPDLSKDIELENVKNRLAIDYQKRKLNEAEMRLLELENNEHKDEVAITSLMDELVRITENIKELERSEVT